jgi:hypothetical protein
MLLLSILLRRSSWRNEGSALWTHLEEEGCFGSVESASLGAHSSMTAAGTGSSGSWPFLLACHEKSAPNNKSKAATTTFWTKTRDCTKEACSYTMFRIVSLMLDESSSDLVRVGRGKPPSEIVIGAGEGTCDGA